MPLAKNAPIFTNQDTRLWVQEDGPGTPFILYGCAAMPEWNRDYREPAYIKCKSGSAYYEHDIKRTIPGEAQEPTFTINAWSPDDEDFLLELVCPVDFQEFFGSCEAPGSPTGYRKIRHFYRSNKTSEGESNMDYLGEEDPAGIQQSVEFSAVEMITIYRAELVDSDAGINETQAFNGIDVLADGRCEGDCGAEIPSCEWVVVGADASYGAATPNVWYSQDGAVTWSLAATDPFSDNSANISKMLILPGETQPRIIAFRGNVSGLYAARCSISDDWGASWSEVDMGGNLNGSYVNNAFAYNSGLIFAVGNGGYIWYSQDRAASWTLLTDATTGTTEELHDIHTPDGNTIFAVGTNNTVIRSQDGTDSWETLSGPAGTATVTLFTVQAPTTYRVIVGGEIDANEDVLWRSTDGGENWNDIDFEGSTTALGRVRRIRVAPKAPIQHMVMIHGAGTSNRVFRTLDGGATWERMALVANNGYNDLAICNINTAFTCGEVVTTAEVHKMRRSTS
jgi:photosystem II stability/assembly factor-like uncharacterized protein